MKVDVSVDMEGVAGVSHSKPTTRDDAGYEAAVELMVGETNAAIESACAGANEVTVNDSHGGMDTAIRYEAPDAVTLFRAFVAAARLSAGGDD